MEIQLKETDHIKSAYNSDKQAFTQAFNGMKGTTNTIWDEYEQSQARLQMVEQERDTLKSDLQFYKERLTLIEQDFENNKMVIQRINSEKDDEVHA